MKKNTKKLSLNREIVRRLRRAQLTEVAAGEAVVSSCVQCPESVCDCPMPY